MIFTLSLALSLTLFSSMFIFLFNSEMVRDIIGNLISFLLFRFSIWALQPPAQKCLMTASQLLLWWLHTGRFITGEIINSHFLYIQWFWEQEKSTSSPSPYLMPDKFQRSTSSAVELSWVFPRFLRSEGAPPPPNLHCQPDRFLAFQSAMLLSVSDSNISTSIRETIFLWQEKVFCLLVPVSDKIH